jgi:uncharacterized protein (DUF58 family)
MAEAPATFLDPALLARLGDLSLLARTVVDGVLHGAHRSRRTGASMDFAEHRAYQPGDDLRRVDWRLVGRTDRYFVKEFEADTTTQLLVALDCSGSMDFGSHAVDKFTYARMLAAALAWLAHGQGDRVGMVAFTDRVGEVVPPAARQRLAVLQALARAAAWRRRWRSWGPCSAAPAWWRWSPTPTTTPRCWDAAWTGCGCRGTT